jgi:hypothetical protein
VQIDTQTYRPGSATSALQEAFTALVDEEIGR